VSRHYRRNFYGTFINYDEAGYAFCGDNEQRSGACAAGSNLDGWFRRRRRERSEDLILSGDHLAEVTGPRVAGFLGTGRSGAVLSALS
jgi:hypothetical protein